MIIRNDASTLFLWFMGMKTEHLWPKLGGITHLDIHYIFVHRHESL